VLGGIFVWCCFIDIVVIIIKSVLFRSVKLQKEEGLGPKALMYGRLYAKRSRPPRSEHTGAIRPARPQPNLAS
jgi:hypothetical protein